MRRRHRSLLGRPSANFFFVVAVGRGVVEPDDQQQVLPGIILDGDRAILVEGDARVGEPFTVWVHPTGWCQGDYFFSGPHEIRVALKGIEVEIRPFALVGPRRPPSTTCHDALAVFRHQVTVLPPVEGGLTIRALGRELPIGGRLQREGTPVTVERSIPVNH